MRHFCLRPAVLNLPLSFVWTVSPQKCPHPSVTTVIWPQLARMLKFGMEVKCLCGCECMNAWLLARTRSQLLRICTCLIFVWKTHWPDTETLMSNKTKCLGFKQLTWHKNPAFSYQPWGGWLPFDRGWSHWCRSLRRPSCSRWHTAT